MGKKREKGGNPKKQTLKSEAGGSGRGDPPDDPMAVEEHLPDFPYFTYNKKRVFESYIPDPNTGTERGAPFKIRHGNESDKIVVRPVNRDERKILRVSHYGDRLSDVLELFESSKRKQRSDGSSAVTKLVLRARLENTLQLGAEYNAKVYCKQTLVIGKYGF